MLSSSVRQVSSRTTRLVVARAMSSSVVAKDAKMPSIKDSIISLTFVDPSGARRKVPGMVGEQKKVLFLWVINILYRRLIYDLSLLLDRPHFVGHCSSSRN